MDMASHGEYKIASMKLSPPFARNAFGLHSTPLASLSVSGLKHNLELF